jgi:CBS domain-containing protein
MMSAQLSFAMTAGEFTSRAEPWREACLAVVEEATMSERTTSTQYIYRHHGEQSVRTLRCEPVEPLATRIATIADCVFATSIMSREVVCARDDLEVDALIDLMLRRRVGCVPIVDAEGAPVGMVTKQDLVELLIAERTEAAYPRTADDVMMPLAFTLDEHATVAHAAAMMASEGMHHVPIVAESGCVIGIVSSYDIVRWLAVNDGFASERRAGDSSPL